MDLECAIRTVVRWMGDSRGRLRWHRRIRHHPLRTQDRADLKPDVGAGVAKNVRQGWRQGCRRDGEDRNLDGQLSKGLGPIHGRILGDRDAKLRYWT